MRTIVLLIPGLLFACSDKDEPIQQSGDTGNVLITVETGLWVDTSDTNETGQDDTADDTGSDTGGDTGGDTGDPVEDPSFSALSLYPDGLMVQPGATFELRLVGINADGQSVDVDCEKTMFSSSDETFASIDENGTVTAWAAGEVVLTATVDDVVGSATLTIEDSGTVRVRVLHAETGSPIHEAKVKVEEGEAARTDSDGWATLNVDTGEAISIHAYLSGYMPVTIYQTVNREFSVHLQDLEWFTDESTQVHGEVDFSGVDSGGGADMVLGLALPALPMGPLLLDPDELMTPDRDLTIFGIDVSLPGNLFLKNHAEEYAVPAQPGDVAVWSIAGPMPISDVTSSMDGASDAFELINEYIDDMSWGWSEVGTLALGDEVQSDLAPTTAMTGSATVTTSDLPLGFSGDEVALVMVGENLSQYGAVALGLGTGLGEVELHVADTSLGGEPVAMAIAQVGGLGSGGGVSAATAELLDNNATLPDFQPVPEMASFDPLTHEFELTSDERSRFVRVIITGADRSKRMVLMDSGDQAGHLADYGGSMGYGQTTWEVLSFETTTDTFEGLIQSGTMTAAQVAPMSTT